MKKVGVRQHPPHVRELDGIRAIAIALVFLTHLFATTPIVPTAFIASLPAPFRVLASHGWLGVDLFFVLSGYLITRILLSAKGRPGYFRSFYLRRLLRIAPLYYTILIVLIAAYGYSNYAGYWNFALGLSANLSTLAGADAPQAAGPMWSLAVEEQFYLFWPFVVLMLSRRALAVVAVAIVAIEPFARYHFGPGQIVYPWCRFDGLALGAILALWFTAPSVTRGRSLRLSAALVGMSLAITAATAPFGGFAEGLLSTASRISEGTLLFAGIIAAVIAVPGLKATGFLRSRALRFVAELSFCLYLVHVPLVDLFHVLSRNVFPAVGALDVQPRIALQTTFVIVAAFAIAMLSRRFIELPLLRLKPIIAPDPEVTPVRTDPSAADPRPLRA